MGEKCHFHALVNLAMVCTQQRDALSCLAQQSHTTMSGTPTSARSNMTRGSSLIWYLYIYDEGKRDAMKNLWYGF